MPLIEVDADEFAQLNAEYKALVGKLDALQKAVTRACECVASGEGVTISYYMRNADEPAELVALIDALDPTQREPSK